MGKRRCRSRWFDM